MKWYFRIILATLALSGCAHQPTTQAPAPLAPTQSNAESDRRANLSLDQISNKPQLLPAPVANPLPPVESIVYFARGTDLLLQDKAEEAAKALQTAIKMDPDSFILYATLGRAQLQRFGGPTPESFDAFEHAALLDPDDLNIHLSLGRDYITAGDNVNAMTQLRLALQTTEYNSSAQGSAAVELFLAHVLQEEGYDRAALDLYLKLTARLGDPNQQLEDDPDVAALAAQPQILWIEMGQIYEKHAQYTQSLDAYRHAADSDPTSFEAQANIVRLLVRLERSDDAAQAVAQVVDRFRANSDSIQLLHHAADALGPDHLTDLIRQLHQKDPSDHGSLFALASLLDVHDKSAQARDLLESALAASPADFRIVQQLYAFHLARNDTSAAAHLLVAQIAAQPDQTDEVLNLFDDLARPLRKNPLTVDALRTMGVPLPQEAARLFLLARIAETNRRQALARSSLQQAVKLIPPFEPAYFADMNDIWSRADFSADQKLSLSQALAQAAGDAGNPSLQSEIDGLTLKFQDQLDRSRSLLEQALAQGGTGVNLQLAYATVLLQQGRTLQYEQILRRLVAQHPMDDAIWDILYAWLESSDQQENEIALISDWLHANPDSSSARLYLADWAAARGRKQSAIEQLQSLLKQHTDDAQILWRISLVWSRTGTTEDFLKQLQTLQANQPTNMALVSFLADQLARAKHLTDASRLLDETHTAVAGDPQRLYELAGLYDRISQEKMKEQILGEVLWLDAANVSAGNDLGYAWADAGTNLDRAEQLIRRAITAEPDNEAFLDSMGWVLYKRGKFADAAVYFERAISPSSTPDPEILDHFGDDLYRMGRSTDARQKWQRSLQRLNELGQDDTDSPNLRLQIQKKLKAAAAGQSVDVAPIGPLANDTTRN